MTTSDAWNNSNDHSYSGVATGGNHTLAVNIPVYDNGVRVFGNEPDGSICGLMTAAQSEPTTDEEGTQTLYLPLIAATK